MSAELEAKVRELEDKLARVTANRDDILREKRELEGRPIKPQSEEDSFTRTLREADETIARADVTSAETARLMRAADRLLAPKDTLPPTNRVVVPRHCPPAQYRELKEQAEKRGVPLVFTDDAPGDPTMRNHGRDQNSRVKFVETDATFYANQAMQRAIGVAELGRRAAAAGKTLRIFRSVDDLVNDPEAIAKHQRIEQAGDPDTLVFGEGI